MNEKLEYLLGHLDCYIEQTVYNVLGDSESDPQYSAVTLFNLIRCYLDVTHTSGLDLCMLSVEDYLRDKCFTEEEITVLSRKRDKESTYYIGERF